MAAPSSSAFCSSFSLVPSSPPTHQFVQPNTFSVILDLVITRSSTSFPCRVFLPLPPACRPASPVYIKPSSPLQCASLSVLLTSLPCLPVAACLFLPACFLCDLHTQDSFPTPALSPLWGSGSHLAFQTCYCNACLIFLKNLL